MKDGRRVERRLRGRAAGLHRCELGGTGRVGVERAPAMGEELVHSFRRPARGELEQDVL
jgi:hypothetical protein